jgi:hypothetical protein
MNLRYSFWITTTALLGGGAYAGYVQPAAVDVDLVNQFAQGDQLTARTADNDLDLIGCGIRVVDVDGSTFEWGFCQAQDSEGDQITCFTESPVLLERIRGLSTYSFITFSWQVNAPFGEECIRVGFSTQSFYLPKEKAK